MSARIDAHQHFWQVGRFPYAWMPQPPSPLCRDYLPDDLAPILERNRFEGAVAVQAAHDPGETEWLLELAGRNAFILGVVGWVDLTDPRVGATLDLLQRNPRFKGVRHMVQDEPDPNWILRDDVIRGLREVAIRDLTFDLLLYPKHLAAVGPRLVERAPRLRMVIDHIAKPPIAAGAWKAGLRTLPAPPRSRTSLRETLGDDHRSGSRALASVGSQALRPTRRCRSSARTGSCLAAIGRFVGRRHLEKRARRLHAGSQRASVGHSREVAGWDGSQVLSTRLINRRKISAR